MNDPDARMQWVNETVQYAIDQKMTGINVDYEGNKKQLTEGYNSAVVELCEAMHAAIPGSEVSIDVPIYPSYEHRNYDYKRMSSACDSLFIMAYDGEFWDNVQCAISQAQCSLACAPLSNVEMGIKEYISQGVPASKLFLGLPWYGLKYERVLNIPFFTGQLQYSAIMDIIKKAGDKGSLKFDDNSSTYVFSCGGKCSQWSDEITDFTSEIWFDNPTSLAPKYALATKYKLAGVGMWEATHVKYDPNIRTTDADAMWDSLCQRTK
jgi:spore germination protein YaaH